MNIERNILSRPLLVSGLLACCLLGSCQSEELVQGSASPSLQIASATFARTEGVSVGDILPNFATRAGTEQPITMGSIGIFRAADPGYNTALSNCQYNYSTGWAPAAEDQTVWLHGDDANVCAYFPYDATRADKTAMVLTSGKYLGTANDLTKTFDPADLCYDVNHTVNAYKRSITFQFKHAQALLELTVSKDAGFLGEGVINAVTYRNPDLIQASTINITNGTYGTPSAKGDIGYGVTGLTVWDAESPVLSTLLVPFTPTGDGLSVVLEMDGIPYDLTIATSLIARYEAGKRYRVSVSFEGTAFKVSGVDCLPWDEVGVGGEDYPYYPVEESLKLSKPIHMGSYDWAWSNLDYVDSKPVLRDVQAWPDGNMWWPYCKLQGSSDSQGGSVGSTSYTYDNDPCSQLVPQGEWRYPTKHQAELLLGADQVAVASGINVTGYWFGTTEVINPKQDDGKYLFLPMQYVTTVGGGPASHSGVFWLSDSPGLALTVPGYTNDVPQIGTYDTQTRNGSVRCVKGAERTTINIGGVEWAMGNLRIKEGTYVIDEHQAMVAKSYGENGAWRDPDTHEWIPGIVDPGYHFNWNRLVNDPIVDGTVYEYDADNDPCGKVTTNGPWRTPTQAEFQTAISLGTVRGEYRINGATVSGIYLGTSKKPAFGNGDDHLFLPDAGAGDIQSYYKWSNKYWTSTEVTFGGENAYEFVGSGAGNVIETDRRKGFVNAVRCVKGKAEKVYNLTRTPEVKIGTMTFARTNLNNDYTFEAEPWISGVMNGTDDDYWLFGKKAANINGTENKYLGSNNWDVLTGEEEDPCKSVAGGAWRLPTVNELKSLPHFVLPEGAKVNVNEEVLTVVGTKGAVSNSDKSTAGTVFYDSTNKTALFIPHAGSGDFGTNSGVMGSIHSSNVLSPANTCQPLYMSKGFCETARNSFNYIYTPNSIRCVKK